jgi:hypothetical protein
MDQNLSEHYSWWTQFLAGETGEAAGFFTLQIIGTATVAQVSVRANC